ncbi:MAG: DUF4924 family protein [Microbacter sp.]
MFTAQKKKEENIAEYMLYMWQIEDVIRAYNFDLELIRNKIIEPSSLLPQQKEQLTEWYSHLIDMMKRENIQTSGHLQFVKNILDDVIDLHYALVKSQKHPDYHAQLFRTLPYMADLIKKTDSSISSKDEIEACFVFLYGILLLKLKKEAITPETETALKEISQLIALLSMKYKKLQNGTLDLEMFEE